MRHEEEFLCKNLVMEGVLAIQEGENPRFIEEKLYKLLPVSVKDEQAEQEEKEEKKLEKKSAKEKKLKKGK